MLSDPGLVKIDPGLSRRAVLSYNKFHSFMPNEKKWSHYHEVSDISLEENSQGLVMNCPNVS